MVQKLNSTTFKFKFNFIQGILILFFDFYAGIIPMARDSHHFPHDVYLSIDRLQQTQPISTTTNWSFVLYERPAFDDEPKPHKLGCSGRLPSSVTEA